MDLSLAGSAFAALIWWVIPIGAVLGALIYVVWVSKFADKYANETNRSVGNFQSFQDSFRGVQVVSETPATRVPNEYLSDIKQPTEHLD